MKIIDRIITTIAMKAAKSAAGAASDWNTYQPKEPASLRKVIKK